MNAPTTYQAPLAPLPMNVRPHLGESAASYIRRLARANHLKPSELHEILTGPGSSTVSIRPERLAALASRPIEDLARALPDLLPPPPPRPRPRPRASRSHRPARPDPTKIDQLVLYSAIRADAQRGYPLRLLAARHHVHRRTVRSALAALSPQRRQVHSRFTRMLDHTRERIDALLDQGLTAREIWCRILDEHDTPIGYVSICSYITRKRKNAPTA